MVKIKELNAEQYEEILYSYKQGDSYQKIADIFQCDKTIIHDVIKHFKETGFAIPKNIYRHLPTQKIQEL
ncbi:6896_t:CDS:2 [Funneliformis geosporum]|uniref:8168_t:CDS:1 n=1 Tax=Funneliformis geosporum TaxID=1117311 RepID=A0A9W4SX44_9GLOM|nr:6896_t:CDS:2 [Funneliformis geosporum]CAI2183891.1 8168_t:CDS:2 [Funneliformis geosporum]